MRLTPSDQINFSYDQLKSDNKIGKRGRINHLKNLSEKSVKNYNFKRVKSIGGLWLGARPLDHHRIMNDNLPA
jgi:hypothetical protein